MGNLYGANRTALWVQVDGPNSNLQLMDVGDRAAGFTGKSLPAAGTTAVYAKGANGLPILIAKIKEAPGELPSGTITIYDNGKVNFLLSMLKRGCPIMVQQRLVECGDLDRPLVYDTADIWPNGVLVSYTPGDGPIQEYNGQLLTVAGELSFDTMIRIVTTGLSRLTTTEDQNILSIDGLRSEDCNECSSGYPGADMIMYAGAAHNTDVADLLATDNGGGSWGIVDAPFPTSVDLGLVQILPLAETTYLVLVGGTTGIAATEARVAYATFEYGDPLNPTIPFVLTDVGTAVNVPVQALFAADSGHIYAAVDGDIFLSTDQGQDYGDAIYTGSVAVNGFAMGPDKSVWAFGATNMILREQNFSTTFAAGVGPSGGGAFTALAVADDGTLVAGNGTALFVNRANARNAGTWTQMHDFGAPIVKIQLVGKLGSGLGYSQAIRVVVDDTTGLVYESLDGGATFKQIISLTNAGYNDAYFSMVDDNKAVIVGDVESATGVIHLLSPA